MCGYGNFPCYLLSLKSRERDGARFDGDNGPDPGLNSNRRLRVLGVIAEDCGSFIESAIIANGLYLQVNRPLTSGRDSPVEPGYCAASAGFNALYGKDTASFIIDLEGML